LSKAYKEFLKKKGLEVKRLEPPKARDGSFELWSYYHLGLPSFSLDFWSLPEPEKGDEKKSDITPEMLEKMSSEEFLALGKEKIAAFLKSAGSPANIDADMVIKALKEGMMTPKKMAKMLKGRSPDTKGEADKEEEALLLFSDSTLEGKGFVSWQAYDHPTLGKVEIGGAVPFVDNTPPPKEIEKLLKRQVPWVLTLSAKIARIGIKETKVASLGSGLYRLSVWVENRGYLPYPTAMGRRNRRITPVVVTIAGGNVKIMEGKKRSLVPELRGFSAHKVEWLLYAGKPAVLTLKVETVNAWGDTQKVSLGGKK
jgi:hypothetical protein